MARSSWIIWVCHKSSDNHPHKRKVDGDLRYSKKRYKQKMRQQCDHRSRDEKDMATDQEMLAATRS